MNLREREFLRRLDRICGSVEILQDELDRALRSEHDRAVNPNECAATNPVLEGAREDLAKVERKVRRYVATQRIAQGGPCEACGLDHKAYVLREAELVAALNPDEEDEAT